MYVALQNVVKTYDSYLAADHIDLSIDEGRLWRCWAPPAAAKPPFCA